MARFPANDIISLVGSTPRYDLAESFGPDLRLADVVDIAELGDLPLSYGTAAGDPRLRKAFADAHGVDPDDVVITVGGMHALFLLAFILCERGDAAVTTAPLFPLARNALESVGAKIETLGLSFDHRYRLDPLELRGKLTSSTKFVSLASPQNPSGVAISEATLREVLRLVEEICPKAYLLVDETYRGGLRRRSDRRQRGRARSEGDFGCLAVQMPWRARPQARMGDHPRPRPSPAVDHRQVQHRRFLLSGR